MDAAPKRSRPEEAAELPPPARDSEEEEEEEEGMEPGLEEEEEVDPRIQVGRVDPGNGTEPASRSPVLAPGRGDRVGPGLEETVRVPGFTRFMGGCGARVDAA